MISTNLIVFLLVLVSWSASAQGYVVFYNFLNEPVTAGPMGQQTPISGPPGSYYFGLLTAPPGTTAVNQFNFSGMYATNIASPGRFFGNLGAPVPGWGPGDQMSYVIAGWSASLGHDWNPEWQSGIFSNAGYFGFSSMATGIAGFPSGGLGSPWLFLGFGIQTGWNLDPVMPVPEPSATALILLAAAVLKAFYLTSGHSERPPNKHVQPDPATGREEAEIGKARKRKRRIENPRQIGVRKSGNREIAKSENFSLQPLAFPY